MAAAPPGWYDDGHGARRWWDGARWTDHAMPPSTPTPASPRRSRRWVVWASIGAGVAAAAILAAFLLPPLMSVRPGTSEASGDDAVSAVAVVDAYDAAWREADCAAFLASTTERFRAESGFADCSEFETEAEAFSEGTEDYALATNDARARADEMSVSTTETYTVIVDAAGEPLEAPTAESIDWEYTLVRDGLEWVIDAQSPLDAQGEDPMAVVALYDQAFVDADCAKFESVTTAGFRDQIELRDCDAFAAAARGRTDLAIEIEVSPVSTDAMGRAVVAARVDVSVTGEGIDVTTATYRYHLVRAYDAWKIAVLHDVTGGRAEGIPTEEEVAQVAETMAQWRLAYSTGDCDAMIASTTEEFRQYMGWTDCAELTRYVQEQNAYCPMDVRQEDIRYRSRIDGHVGEILVDVVEVCTLDTDESGAAIDPPYQSGSPYRFHLVDVGGTWLIAEDDKGAAAEDEPSNTNERAAVAAMQEYARAWLEVDCDTYFATTTEALRIALNASGCAGFGPAARDYASSVENFALTPTDIERPSASTMEIKAHETYDSLTDADGTPVEVPFPVDEYWVYTLVLADGEWVITDIVALL